MLVPPDFLNVPLLLIVPLPVLKRIVPSAVKSTVPLFVRTAAVSKYR